MSESSSDQEVGWSLGSNPLLGTSSPHSSSSQESSMKKKYTVSDFEYKEFLGEGAYGQVARAVLRETGEEFAVKILDKKQIQNMKKREEVVTERDALNMLNHPNIVKLFCTFQDENSLYFVLELVSGGELFQYLRKLGPRPEEISKYYVAEMICALEYMHSKGVVHRDLKPENILLAASNHIKITDFGTALVGKDGAAPSDGHSFVGTAEYVSPEVLSSNASSPSSDLWALGCIIYQMLVGKVPFRGDSEYLTFQEIINVNYFFPEDISVSDVAKDLIHQLLQSDPGSRIGCRAEGYEELKAHPFFLGINFDTLHYEDIPSLIQEGESMSSDSPPAENPEDAVWRDFLAPGESVLHVGLVVKSRKWSSKKRHLILTDAPRFFYVDPKSMQLKGEIPFSKDIWVEWRNDRDFIVHVPGRDYILQDINCDAKSWVDWVLRLKRRDAQ